MGDPYFDFDDGKEEIIPPKPENTTPVAPVQSTPAPVKPIAQPATIPVESQPVIEEPPYPLVKELPSNTLDEPLSATFMRDLRVIGNKLVHVLWPLKKDDGHGLSTEWDLWGPLLFSLIFATVLSINSSNSSDSNYNSFAFGFFIIWICGILISANAILIGGQISFLQTVCLLGYCLAPISVGAVLCWFWNNYLYRGIILAGAIFWSVWASNGFISESILPGKKFEAVYPVGLMYVALGWVVFTMGRE
ncbi:protein YIPF6-like [Aduncisulcus paluster]|uniref:Protein YIPF n=1 Tax=Aduncisulcus paluster TaxID=2918883 RepID=A0ABQ5KQJ2_9EUKA|nr:protein YIPF6-like [Aduncisulcus paluster]